MNAQPENRVFTLFCHLFQISVYLLNIVFIDPWIFSSRIFCFPDHLIVAIGVQFLKDTGNAVR